VERVKGKEKLMSTALKIGQLLAGKKEKKVPR
jgi:hypothetical protein